MKLEIVAKMNLIEIKSSFVRVKANVNNMKEHG